MSKSKGNVINPDKVIKEEGADTLRVYEMFMGPFEQAIPWDTKGLKGSRRFLERVWKFQDIISDKDNVSESLINQTIKKVGEDIEELKFNTAISSLMVLANKVDKQISKETYSTLLILLFPFASHLAEELWQRAGFKGMCSEQGWPKYKSIKEKKANLIIQINGKVRDKVEIETGLSQKKAESVAKTDKIKNYIKGKKIKKIIFVKDKIINFVID